MGAAGPEPVWCDNPGPASPMTVQEDRSLFMAPEICTAWHGSVSPAVFSLALAATRIGRAYQA